jgi:S1-C subfamily serine protease
MVLRVLPSSVAEKAGMKRGEIIAKVDGKPVLSAAECAIALDKALTKANGAVVHLAQADGRDEQLVLKPGD